RMRFVPIKTNDQLDLQALHRVRDRLVRRRTGIINQIRAFLLEVMDGEGVSGAPGEARTPDPLLRSYAVQNSKCRFWCRLRGDASFISPLNRTEVGLKIPDCILGGDSFDGHGCYGIWGRQISGASFVVDT
ncbi:MAG: transposase, partial [Blastocatellia bacterium]|nr:transposase [Blastocatellia bacterium]